MNSRIELEKRYPEADFSVYFRELFARCTTKRENTHEHHICPKKQFPELCSAPENLVTLTVDDHAFIHKLLEAACGIKAPPTAYFEMQHTYAAKGGRVGGASNKRNRTGICKMTREQLQENGRSLTRAQHQAAGRVGGLGGTREQKQAAGRVAARC